MKNKLYEYMYDESIPFVFLGTSHVFSIILFLVLAFSIPYLAKKNLNENQQHSLGKIIGVMVLIGYLSWVILEILSGSFNLKLHLPFHLCRTANVLIFIVLFFRSFLAYEIVFFWGLTVIHAVITPDITQGFPHYHFVRYWLTHQLMIIGIIYATFVYDIRPHKTSIYKSFVALLLFFLITIPVNLFLDANYFWICGKPPVGTVLDYFGPWPWYLVVATLLALIHFYFFYYLINFISSKISK